jgi:uncharacterized protein (DUF58 family)
MPSLSFDSVSRLWDRVIEYRDTVRHQAWFDRPIRRWRPGGQSDAPPLNEEYLRRLERLAIFANRAVKAGLIGEHTSRRKANSIEFADYRNYVPGDDFRRIDWNVYGRLNTLLLKLTEAKEDVAVHILIDSSASMEWGQPAKLAYAKQIAAAIGYIALSRFDAITVASFGQNVRDYMPVTRGQAQAMNLFNFLNHIEVGGETDLNAAAADHCTRSHVRGVAIVISDLLMTQGTREGLHRLVRHGLETAVVHLLDSEEIEPTMRGDVELIDVETGERIEMTVGPEAIRSYQQRVQTWCDEIDGYCRKMGVRYLRMDTSMPFERMVVQYLRARRILS